MTHEFGIARGIDAQAFGQPGQRTFRLRIAGDGDGTASIWMEKEQLQALRLAFTQMLSQLEYDTDPPPPADVGDFPTTATHDFRVGRMGMGFHADDRTIVLYVYEVGLEDNDEPTLRARLSQEQCASLAAQLDDVIAGGRPLCPLCGMAMESTGHACVRSNGHSKQPIPEEDHDDDEQP